MQRSVSTQGDVLGRHNGNVTVELDTSRYSSRPHAIWEESCQAMSQPTEVLFRNYCNKLLQDNDSSIGIW